jgi:limonene-1,2-epoxide hydrolase
MATTEAARIIDRFVAAWQRRDVDELLNYFTEDATWYPMPMEPAVGKRAIRELLTAWLSTAPRGEVHRQVSDGNFVMHERTDRCSIDGHEYVSPVGAAFEIDENGRIAAWREYFDMSPFAALR